MFDIFSKSTKQCDRQKQIRGGLGAESDRIKIIVSELTIFWISGHPALFTMHKMELVDHNLGHILHLQYICNHYPHVPKECGQRWQRFSSFDNLPSLLHCLGNIPYCFINNINHCSIMSSWNVVDELVFVNILLRSLCWAMHILKW